MGSAVLATPGVRKERAPGRVPRVAPPIGTGGAGSRQRQSQSSAIRDEVGARRQAPAARREPWRPRQRSPAVAEPHPAPRIALVVDLAKRTSIVARLQLLWARCEELSDLAVDRLAEVVEVFPPGWPRRRALAGLLERGMPADLGEALDLVSRVGDEASRPWAISCLAGRPDLKHEEKERILAAAEGSPALERRVAILLGLRRPRRQWEAS